MPRVVPDPDIAYLEALHRGRGRTEQRIRDPKDTGLRNLPSESFAINAAWLAVVLTAQDLMVWAPFVCLDGELARAEPKRLRYCLFHTAGVITHSGRRTWLRLADGWPWADQLAARVPPPPNALDRCLINPGRDQRRSNAPADTENPLIRARPRRPGTHRAPTITGNTANNAAEPRSDPSPTPY